jgi:hypothetical protein
MRNKVASSFMLALALVGSLVLPSRADDDTFKSIVQFPVKVAGSAVGTAVGVPEGMVKDGVKGAMMSTEWAAERLGNKDGRYQQFFGALLAGPVGIVGGAAYGSFDGGWHGMRTGFEKPFSKEAFTFKED